MPSRHIHVEGGVPLDLVPGLEALADRLDVPGDFPPEVLADAEAFAAAPVLPDRDLTAIGFVTIDPDGSMDLDQALHIARDGDGYVVHYAIADVPSWVKPGSALDAETHARGQTYYAPQGRNPLHPPVLSEQAASLLADGVARPAIVWTMHVDAAGVNTSTTVERARVINTRKMTYVEVQAMLDDGSAIETVALLREVGLLRQEQERRRGGVSLAIPEQEVVAHGADWELEYRRPLPCEDWNAQISLMTGMAAADLMIGAKVGILRTLPAAESGSLNRLRRIARALHIDWPADVDYPAFLRTLSSEQPNHLAMLTACTSLFRGAGYVAFNGELPSEDYKHNALAAHYAHTTAPLRRLIDRYVLETCVNIAAGLPVPAWVTDAFDALPGEMSVSDQREKRYERGIVDLVEALVMKPHVGEEFTGVVTEFDQHDHDGRIVIDPPAVEGNFRGDARLGDEIRVKLAQADLERGYVEFRAVGRA